MAEVLYDLPRVLHLITCGMSALTTYSIDQQDTTNCVHASGRPPHPQRPAGSTSRIDTGRLRGRSHEAGERLPAREPRGQPGKRRQRRGRAPGLG